MNTYAFKAKQFIQLLKVRLTSFVIFSGVFGFLLATEGAVNWVKLIALAIGSFLITGAANTINQIIEKDLDKLMKRTQNRPLPSNRLSVSEAIIFTLILTTLGGIILANLVNVFTALLSILSLILYGFVYTPLKQKSSIAVLVGAFPGAFPPLIGWVAATGEISTAAIIIFGIQFIWQFPHFWAIAWVGDEDYRKAGFYLLPSRGGKDFNSAFQMMLYTLFLLPLGILPLQYGITGWVSAVVVTLAAAAFIGLTVVHIFKGTRKAALRILFGSFFYLPIMQIAFLIDKI